MVLLGSTKANQRGKKKSQSALLLEKSSLSMVMVDVQSVIRLLFRLKFDQKSFWTDSVCPDLKFTNS